MVRYVKNKKAIGFSEQAILYIIALLFLVSIVFASYHYVSTSKNHVEMMAPSLNYEYPPLFVKSFLMLEVSDEDKEDLNLKVEDIIYVHDLIFIGDDDSKEVVDKMKEEYLKDKDVIESFNQFIEFSKINLNNNDLLYIYYEENNIPDLQGEVEHNNYVFYFKGKDKKYRYIYFRRSTLNVQKINERFDGMKGANW